MCNPAFVALRVTASVVIVATLAACAARPVGDFGRARPSFTNDTAMPAIGDSFAGIRGEPVSNFVRTDQEQEMHDRVWRFLIAAHAKDWVFDSSVELQRTRIIPPRKDEYYSTHRYYEWLKGTSFQSSRTRYSKVGSDVTSDIDTLPTTFAAICAVLEIDRQRAAAYSGLSQGLAPETADGLAARKYENDAFIAWFVRALTYRYQSYGYALDNLLVETPHEQSLAVDEALRRMEPFVQKAQRNDFCSGANTRGNNSGPVIPSRYQRIGDQEVVLPK